MHENREISSAPLGVSRGRSAKAISRTLAKKAGVYKGRKRALTPERAKELRDRVNAGEKKAAVARDFGISRETLYSYL